MEENRGFGVLFAGLLQTESFLTVDFIS